MAKKIRFLAALVLYLTLFSVNAFSQPTISINALPLDMTTENRPVFLGQVVDRTYNVITVECRIDGGSWSSASPQPFDAKLINFSFRPTDGLARSAASHLLEVRAEDSAGLTSTESYSFYIVSERPELLITENGQSIVMGDSLPSNPSFEVKVISNQGLTQNPLNAYIDNIFTEALTKKEDPANSGIITAIYNPILADGTHSLKIDIKDDAGNISTAEVIGLVVQAQSDTTVQGTPLPYPNPYNGTGNVNLSYELNRNSNISITIHDITGNQLAKLSYLSGQTGGTAGYNQVIWDGKTAGGQDLGNGIYIFLIVADGTVVGKGKLTVAR